MASPPDAHRTALLIGAHPPGRGSGTGLRAMVILRALRSSCGRVDSVSLESPGEARWADPATLSIPRRPDPSLPVRIAALRYGSAYYTAERMVGLTDHLRKLVAQGILLPRYDIVVASQSLSARAAHVAVGAGFRILDIDNIAAAERRRSAADPNASPAIRAFRRIAARALAQEERARCNLFDVVQLPSDLERDRLGSVDTEVVVVPNTVDAAQQVRPEQTTSQMLFMGSLDYEPNIDGLTWIATEILPLVRRSIPEAALTVLGRNPSPTLERLCRDSRIDLITAAPDLDPYHQTSRLMLAPLRLGGGTRFKILDGLARGEAIVATSTAAEGLKVEDGRDIVIADTAPELARACVRLLEDGPAAARIGAGAFKTWFAHYRSDLAVDQMVELIESRVTSGKALERQR